MTSKRNDYLDISQVKQLISYLEQSEESRADNDRLGLMVKMAFYSAMRLSELMAIRPEDIDYRTETISLRHTKNNRPREVIMSLEYMDHLRNYIKYNREAIDNRTLAFNKATQQAAEKIERKGAKDGWSSQAIKNRSHGEIMELISRGKVQAPLWGITYGAVYKAMTKLPARAGINAIISPHTLRHSFGRWYLSQGGRMEKLQKIMGHASIQTTIDTYGHQDMATIKDEYRAIVDGGRT